MFGGLIEFDPPAGPSLNTVPDPATNTIAIQINGVYEISADITVLLESGESVGFWIEGSSTGMIVGSRFDTFISNIQGDIIMNTTIGRTVQTNLIAGETVFIRAVSEAGSARYRSASFTVNRIGP
ncbi:hypothetical protein LIS82_22300 [Cytobacillus solani]|nr:hypothetical protein [Cytobacillus solani]USK54258.1 hypothetical protein LIS82_22300 [Cytobacillus solani]